MLLLIVLLTLVLACSIESATTTAASCSNADVQAAINSMVPGDTVLMPAGTCAWTAKVTAPDISLIGQGPGVTILQDSVPRSGGGQNGTALRVEANAGFCPRVSGFTTEPGGETANHANGLILLTGLSTCTRIDHIHINGTSVGPVIKTNSVYGVADHIIGTDSGFKTFILVAHAALAGQTSGDGAWTLPVNFGSGDFFFIEDSTFTYTGGVTRSTLLDSDSGGRWVVRRSTCHDCGITVHGTESGGRLRGSYVGEIYDNTFDTPNLVLPDSALEFRAGTGVVYNNTITDFKTAIKLTLNRRTDRFTSYW